MTEVYMHNEITVRIPMMIAVGEIFHILFQGIMLRIEKILAVQFHESKDAKQKIKQFHRHIFFRQYRLLHGYEYASKNLSSLLHPFGR